MDELTPKKSKMKYLGAFCWQLILSVNEMRESLRRNLDNSREALESAIFNCNFDPKQREIYISVTIEGIQVSKCEAFHL